jgi:hypothetical protein
MEKGNGQKELAEEGRQAFFPLILCHLKLHDGVENLTCFALVMHFFYLPRILYSRQLEQRKKSTGPSVEGSGEVGDIDGEQSNAIGAWQFASNACIRSQTRHNLPYLPTALFGRTPCRDH